MKVDKIKVLAANANFEVCVWMQLIDISSHLVASEYLVVPKNSNIIVTENLKLKGESNGCVSSCNFLVYQVENPNKLTVLIAFDNCENKILYFINNETVLD